MAKLIFVVFTILYFQSRGVIIAEISNKKQTHTQASYLAPVYLKFHKVGSATVKSFLQSAFSPTPWWKCKSEPFTHEVLEIYHSRNGNLSSCVLPHRNGSVPIINPIAILRHPLERIISQISFFSKELKNELKYLWKIKPPSFNTNRLIVLSTIENVRRNPSSISVNEMITLMDIMKNNSIHFSSNLQLNEYEQILQVPVLDY